jgi:hypothetical protein
MDGALVEYRPSRLVDAGSPAYSRDVKALNDRLYLSVVSYPETTDKFLKARSFVYDDALALIWFTWKGDARRAWGLANTLLLIQNGDGSFGFSFSTGSGGFYNARYIRTGTVAWAAYALGYFGSVFGDAAARLGAERAVAYLGAITGETGLIEGGRGLWSADYKSFDPSFILETAVTEHQFDSYLAYVQAAKLPTAKRLEETIISRLWIGEEGRFSTAMTGETQDRSGSLDAAGAWGGLWLLMAGKKEMGERSYAYAREKFAVSDGIFRGYKPYLDNDEVNIPGGGGRLVFMEGTLGMGLLAARLGDTASATEALSAAALMVCLTGSGVPYASRSERNFPATPSVSATLWYLFLEMEISSGVRSPLFALPGKYTARPA